MKVTNNQDIEILHNFLLNILEKFENDSDKFLEIISGIFSSVFDYSTINQNEMNENLKIELIKYPNLLNKFNEKAPKNTYLITYEDFKQIHNDIQIILQDSLMEYFIYLMKKNVPYGHSIFSLSYKIIEDLLYENLPLVEDIIKSSDNKKLTSVEEIIDPEKIKDQEINYEEIKNTEEFKKNNDLKDDSENLINSNQFKNTNDLVNTDEFRNTDDILKNTDFQNNMKINKIKEFKKNLNDNNLQFNNLIDRKVENIENDEGNVKRGIRKDDFIEILKENGVDVEKDEEQSIYEKYKMDEKFNDSQQLLDITLIENEMAKND